MSNKHVYIIHGYAASPTDHWFPWLKQKLETQGATVTVLALPDSQSPTVEAWDQYLKNNVALPDKNTFFVAHSLGCITLLRYLSALPEHSRVGGITIVSGFAEPLQERPQLNPFVKEGYAVEKVKRISGQYDVIASKNDSIVPYVLTKHLAQQLGANLTSLENGGHFLAREGFQQFDTVYDVVERQMNAR